MKKKLYIIVIFFLVLLLSTNKIYSNNSATEDNLVAELYLQKNDSTLLMLYKKSDSLFKAKNYTLSLRFALKILDDAEEKNELELITNTNYLIGKILYESRDYEDAVSYLKSSLEGFIILIENTRPLIEFNEKELKDNISIMQNNFDIGRSYQRLFEISYQKKDTLLKIIYRDSTLYHYDKILESSLLTKESNILKSKTYYNLSGLYVREDSLSLAEEYALKSIDIDRKYGDQYDIAAGYNALFGIYFSRGNYEKAKNVLFEGEKALDKIKGEKADEIRAAIYINIAYSMYLLKDYKAYEYQEKSWDLYDKIKDRKNQFEIAGVKADKNFENGMKEGILKEEVKRQKVQRNTWILGISSFFIIVLLVFVLKQYKLRQKNLGLELSKQELMQQQRLEKIRNDAQVRILNATLDGKETERKQIAETLHDSVSALLSSANLHLQACKTQFNGKTPVEVDKSQSIINEASQKIRDLSHTLVSSILLKFGLSYAIKDIAEKFSNSQLQIDYETKYIKRYDQGFEIKLYNITQEFINNILKHSNASQASIVLVEKNKKLQLTIKDNGDGFDKELIPEKDGLGLNQIDARIQMMQGKFNIESGKGKGTTISIELPVFEKVLTKFS